jgi:hypothetical protein
MGEIGLQHPWKSRVSARRRERLGERSPSVPDAQASARSAAKSISRPSLRTCVYVSDVTESWRWPMNSPICAHVLPCWWRRLILRCHLRQPDQPAPGLTAVSASLRACDGAIAFRPSRSLPRGSGRSGWRSSTPSRWESGSRSPRGTQASKACTIRRYWRARSALGGSTGGARLSTSGTSSSGSRRGSRGASGRASIAKRLSC